ncbi:MAG: phosphodiester glycosidase family protein, partial [Burkholderiales bacterium]|nr:phosphodiester glycosidase family protein [Burkholderiales bacterium]
HPDLSESTTSRISSFSMRGFPKIKNFFRIFYFALGGKIHPAFNPQSSSRFIRNGVGIVGKEALFVMSEKPVTFYEFAVFFRDVLHCQDALYLDGAVSSLYSSKLNKDVQRSQLGPMIAVVE